MTRDGRTHAPRHNTLKERVVAARSPTCAGALDLLEFERLPLQLHEAPALSQPVHVTSNCRIRQWSTGSPDHAGSIQVSKARARCGWSGVLPAGETPYHDLRECRKRGSVETGP